MPDAFIKLHANIYAQENVEFKEIGASLDTHKPRALLGSPLDGGARSSAGEHCLHTAGVTGSIPVAPTIPTFFIVLFQ